MSRLTQPGSVAMLTVALVLIAPPPGHSASSIFPSQVPAPALGRPLPANIYVPDGEAIETGGILQSTGDHYAGAIGSPFDAELFYAKDVFTLAQDAIEAEVDQTETYLTFGDDDGLNPWRGAIALHETLLDDGHPSELCTTYGDHIWSL